MTSLDGDRLWRHSDGKVHVPIVIWRVNPFKTIKYLIKPFSWLITVWDRTYGVTFYTILGILSSRSKESIMLIYMLLKYSYMCLKWNSPIEGMVNKVRLGAEACEWFVYDTLHARLCMLLWLKIYTKSVFVYVIQVVYRKSGYFCGASHQASLWHWNGTRVWLSRGTHLHCVFLLTIDVHSYMGTTVISNVFFRIHRMRILLLQEYLEWSELLPVNKVRFAFRQMWPFITYITKHGDLYHVREKYQVEFGEARGDVKNVIQWRHINAMTFVL